MLKYFVSKDFNYILAHLFMCFLLAFSRFTVFTKIDNEIVQLSAVLLNVFAYGFWSAHAEKAIFGKLPMLSSWFFVALRIFVFMTFLPSYAIFEYYGNVAQSDVGVTVTLIVTHQLASLQLTKWIIGEKS